MRHGVVDLHVPLEQILHGEGVSTSGNRAAVGARAQARAAQQRAARAARAAVRRAHVRRALRLGAQRTRSAAASTTNPYLVLAAVRYREMDL